MARTQAADFEQKKEEIIDKAARLFAARGFLGASIADIADACKVSKSLIYHYYGSKEDILFAAMESHVAALNQAADQAMAEESRPDAQLRRLARGFMELYVGAAARHQVLLNDLAYLPDERRTVIIERQRRLIVMVERILAALQPGLAARKGLLRSKTMLFFGMINWTNTWFRADGPIKPSEIADMACDMILEP